MSSSMQTIQFLVFARKDLGRVQLDKAGTLGVIHSCCLLISQSMLVIKGDYCEFFLCPKVLEEAIGKSRVCAFIFDDIQQQARDT